jgi:hypothetical protein
MVNYKAFENVTRFMYLEAMVRKTAFMKKV